MKTPATRVGWFAFAMLAVFGMLADTLFAIAAMFMVATFTVAPLAWLLGAHNVRAATFALSIPLALVAGAVALLVHVVRKVNGIAILFSVWKMNRIERKVDK